MLKTNESAENYLETILVLSQKKPVVRGVDIAEELGFKKSSVSVAMKNLREKEQIRVKPELPQGLAGRDPRNAGRLHLPDRQRTRDRRDDL